MDMSNSSSNSHFDQFKTDPIEYNRQTGRTTRMMEAAKGIAIQGAPVVVIFMDERSAGIWRQKYKDVKGMTVIPMSVNMPELDWKKLKITDGPYAYHQTFIDHDVLFVYNKELFKAYCRYDLPMDQAPYLVPPQQQTA